MMPLFLSYFLRVKTEILIPNKNAAKSAHFSEIGSKASHRTEDVAEHAADYVQGFTIKGILEVRTFIGFLGLFVFVALTVLSKSALVPKNDTYLEESLHHHVI